jgi:hypothetical protein
MSYLYHPAASVIRSWERTFFEYTKEPPVLGGISEYNMSPIFITPYKSPAESLEALITALFEF